MERTDTYFTTTSDLFYFKGFIVCSLWHKNLTAYVTTNRHKKTFNYYACKDRDCPHKGKIIRHEKVEVEFIEELKRIQPDSTMLELIEAYLLDHVDKFQKSKNEEKKLIETKIKNLDTETKRLTNKLLIIENETALKAISDEIAKQGIVKNDLLIELEKLQIDNVDYEQRVKFVLNAYRRVYLTLQKADSNLKKVLIRLVLDSPIIVDLNTLYLTLESNSLINKSSGLLSSNTLWCIQRDSNPRPLVPKTNTLSS